MMKTKNLLTLTVLLLFMFLTRINTYADVIYPPPSPPPPPIPGVAMLFIGITVAVIALIAFFIIRHIRKDKKT